MKDRLFGPAALLLFAGFLAFDIWLLFIQPKGSWQDHAGLWFAVVGLLALATGFANSTDLRKALPADLDNMTSPWPREFLRGNLFVAGLSMSFGAALVLGGAPRTLAGLERLRDTWLWPLHVLLLIGSALLKMIAALLIFLLWIGANAAYLVLVAPAAYPAYAAIGFPLLAIRKSTAPPEKYVVHPDVDPPKIVKEHEVQLRAFAVGALGTISGFLLNISALY